MSLLATALLLAGVISWFASTHPDGLEWSYMEHKYGQTQEAVHPPSKPMGAVDEFHAKYTPLPDYSTRSAGEAPEAEEADDDAWPNVSGWGSLAGLIGTVVTLGLVYGLAVLLRRRRAPPQNAAERG